MKQVITIIIITLFFLSNPLSTFAGGIEETCQPIYGGGKTCQQTGELTINLTVQNPQTKSFTDNVSRTEHLYLPGETVSYQITVTNVSKKETVSQAKIKLLFPQFVDFVSGSGTYDKKTKNLDFTIEKLEPTKSQTITVTGKVIGKEALPKTQEIVCAITQAIATNGNKQSQDNSQVCIQKEKPSPTPVAKQQSGQTPSKSEQTTKGGLSVFPTTQTKQTPQTGAETLALIGLIPTAGLGYWLRRKTQ